MLENAQYSLRLMRQMKAYFWWFKSYDLWNKRNDLKFISGAIAAEIYNKILVLLLVDWLRAKLH